MDQILPQNQFDAWCYHGTIITDFLDTHATKPRT